ncbi:50S ribosomal protein L32 [Bombiscardovia apis]|uniref:Large ribosomal subunit protein bL32 n=1 Tax=Bombiscardovia apis TaxID=2932182 RepID=A0ABM8BBF9_9BIFI|nr:50S ribosomal protein L32 [Bombiscardovia apis]BDR54201.1 50S ribosomal protein L32 [Bombiscardovia apis]
MALPKYKTSRANTHMRRANWKTQAANTVTCPNCGAATLSHMACPTCGSYRGRVYRDAIQSKYAAK